MTTQRELEAAFFFSKRTEPAGLSDEALQELGIPVDADDFQRHVAAGKETLAVSNRIKRELGKAAVTCADCSAEITPGTGCSHIRMGTRGKLYRVATY